MGSNIGKRELAASLVLGFVLAASMAACWATAGAVELPVLADPQTGPLIIGAASAVVFIATSVCSYLLLRKSARLLAWADAKDPVKRLSLDFDARGVLVASVVLLVFWSPWIALQFPVAMNGDTYNQLYQYQTSAPTLYTTMGTTVDESFVDHHPVFDSLLYGAFISLGDALGSQNAGLFLFSLVQCALFAIALGATCCYMERLGVPKVFRLVSLAFFALFPAIPLWAACMVKDSTNACMFIYFALVVVEAVRSRGKVFESKRVVVAYLVIACLCILTKKTGAIVVVASTLVLLLYLRSHVVALALGLAVPVAVCFALVPAFLYPAIGGVAPGGKQEMFGFAFQQVITAILENDDLTEQEREAVGAVLKIDDAKKNYKPGIADPVKNRAVKGATTQDYLNFIPAYFSIGARHPGAYTASALRIAGMHLAPGRVFSHFVTPEQDDSWVQKFEEADIKGELHLTFDKPEPIKSAAESYEAFRKWIVRWCLPLRVVASTGFYGGWIPMICLVMCLFADRKWAVALVPQLAVVAVMLISPASSIRYVLPLLYTAPLMLAVLCAALRCRYGPRRS